MRYTHLITGMALVAAAALTGCRGGPAVTQNGALNAPADAVAERTLPTGTSIDVTLASPLTSETAGVGDTWTGSTRTSSRLDGRNLIPAGSPVSGTVTGVRAARKGDRAMLDLALTSFTVGDHRYRVRASMESIVAGSTRARNLGAIGAATVAGAVIGHAIGGSGKGTLIGGLIGGGAATGAVSQTRGWQVALKEGTALTFTTNEAVAVRL